MPDSRPDTHVNVVQSASMLGGKDVLEEFLVQVSKLAAAPFAGPDQWGRFGTPPRAVRVFLDDESVIVECPTRDPELANGALHQFLELVGTPAATRIGRDLSLSVPALPLPKALEQPPQHVPHAGKMLPKYRAYVPRGGEPTFVFEGWATAPAPLAAFQAQSVSFFIDDPLSTEEATLVGTAIKNMQRHTANFRGQVTPFVYRYYKNCIAGFSADELSDYEIPIIDNPDAVWDHVSIGTRPHVVPSQGSASRYLHSDVAYVVFTCGCNWEREHGMSLVFVDGLRLSRVSAVDGHLTTAAAYGDVELLDVLIRD